ncbi:hypothetical protein Pelo_6760 [Pelomyxa schiedti]|nr:hypothetical protein Pelo_6760 [Pelomyxa schiedti]
MLSFERVLDARRQLVALATATHVPRCGSSSHARLLTPTVLHMLGVSWVVRRSTHVAFNLSLEHSLPGLSVFPLLLGLSPTLGVVSAASLEAGLRQDEGEDELTAAALVGDSAVLVCVPGSWAYRVLRVPGGGGDSRVQVLRDLGELNGGLPATVAANSKWLVSLGNSRSAVWRVVDGTLLGPPQGDEILVPFEITVQDVAHFTSNLLPPYVVGPGDELSILLSTGDLVFVDVNRTFETKSLFCVSIISVGFGSADFSGPLLIANMSKYSDIESTAKSIATYNCVTQSRGLIHDASWVCPLDNHHVGVIPESNVFQCQIFDIDNFTEPLIALDHVLSCVALGILTTKEPCIPLSSRKW